MSLSRVSSGIPAGTFIGSKGELKGESKGSGEKDLDGMIQKEYVTK